MKKHNLLIAMDGLAASGKGALAKKLAEYFKIPHLNTGALYRLIAYRMMNNSINPELIEENLDFLITNNPINEKDLENEDLLTEDVGLIASIIAKNVALRKALFDFQKNFAIESKRKFGGAILEGRDTTTVICPDADYKFFIQASLDTRARRRFNQLKEQNRNIGFAEIRQKLEERDKNDLDRKDSPVKQADDAILIDNDTSTIEESFKTMISKIENGKIQ